MFNLKKRKTTHDYAYVVQTQPQPHEEPIIKTPIVEVDTDDIVAKLSLTLGPILNTLSSQLDAQRDLILNVNFTILALSNTFINSPSKNQYNIPPKSPKYI